MSDFVLGFLSGFIAFPFAYFGVKQGWEVVKQCAYWVKDKVQKLIGK